MAVHRLPIQRGAKTDTTHESADPGPAFRWRPGRVYAICFDFDTKKLEEHHPLRSKTAGYDDIRRVLERHGFRGIQGSVYFGGTDPVDCFVAVKEATERYPWLKFVVRDIRMLRVEENSNLMRVVNPQAELPLDRTA